MSKANMVPADRAKVDVSGEALELARQQRIAQFRRAAIAVFRAMDGWRRVTTEEAWLEACAQAVQDYHSGRFVIEQLGAERHLDPQLMATLWGLRQALVTEESAPAAEAMLADLAIASYYNTVRIQRWIGDLALATERELWGAEGPSARFEEKYGEVAGLTVEVQLKNLGEELLPLLDRAHRMTIRSLKALAEMRRAPAPSVAIGTAQQVNVGTQQVNVAEEAGRRDNAMPATGNIRERSRR